MYCLSKSFAATSMINGNSIRIFNRAKPEFEQAPAFHLCRVRGERPRALAKALFVYPMALRELIAFVANSATAIFFAFVNVSSLALEKSPTI